MPNGKKLCYINGTRVKKNDFSRKAAEYKEKQEVISIIESVLEDFSKQIPDQDNVSHTDLEVLFEDLNNVELFLDNLIDESRVDKRKFYK